MAAMHLFHGLGEEQALVVGGSGRQSGKAPAARRRSSLKAPYSRRSSTAGRSQATGSPAAYSNGHVSTGYQNGNSNGNGNGNGNGSSGNGNGNGSSGQVASPVYNPHLLALLQQVASGHVRPDTAALQLRELSSGYQQVSEFATVDTWRQERTGEPAVIWGENKSPEDVAAIMQRMSDQGQLALATRIEPHIAAAVSQIIPTVEYKEAGRVLKLTPPGAPRRQRLPGTVALISAGTADNGVAEECRVIADAMGCYCFRLSDVSVDGLHRVLQNIDAIRAADVVVVVSGGDGAVPSVVAGLIAAPVIAVPTSVGYGASLGGISSLLSSLTASSPGVVTVNIDNGFGAAVAAARILRSSQKLTTRAMRASQA